MDDYVVFGGKNDGKLLSEHVRGRVNKSFAILNVKNILKEDILGVTVLQADIAEPCAIWLKE